MLLIPQTLRKLLEQGRQKGEKEILDRLESQGVITPKQRREAEVGKRLTRRSGRQSPGKRTKARATGLA